MKKFFIFALVACALAFTSCEPKIDSPLVGSWNTRGYILEEGVVRECLCAFSFFDNGTFNYGDYIIEDGYAVHDGYVTEGAWSVDGDKLTLRKQKAGKSHDGNRTYDPNYKASEELIKWHIDGHYLYLVRYYGTSDQREESYYDGKGQD